MPDGTHGLLYVEDIAVGPEVDLGEWVVTRTDIIAFARQWDPQSFHVDPESPAASQWGDVIASGVHTFSILQRLTVDAVLSRFAYTIGRSITEFKARRPVLPGVTLFGKYEFTTVTCRDDGRASVEYRSRLEDRDGQCVFEIAGDMLVPCRG
jgi:acyl dehydratase